MPLATGHKLAHYEILELIGKGGMGEVYRARDRKLGRDVAIKVLPDELAENEERLARFKREAKVLASLNHPGIAAIYGLEESEGTHYLILELVPGETLAERIARGPIPVEEALQIVIQIAESLEEAHEHGIVHRDLKPANIKITPDGKVKVLDFGLAKAFVDETRQADSSMSPTITRDATRVGVILGTAAYMSPEQAKGKTVDKRADVWAFGAVLYEMLTGKRAFDGEDVSETLAHVLTKEPVWDALSPATPATLRRTLQLCLTKDVKRRVRDIGDVRMAMEGTFDTATDDVSLVDASRPAGLRSLVLVGLAGLIVGAVIVGVVARGRTRQVPSPVSRFSLELTSPLAVTPAPPLVAISPDGSTVVYTGFDQLYLRDLSELASRPIPNTEGANSPFFSPDGRWVGFQAGDRRMLKKVSLTGGPAVTLAETSVAGASWGPDDTILFGVGGGALAKVSAEGGDPKSVTSLAPGEVGHWRPDFSAGRQGEIGRAHV
jgi:serine/threonine-protein kinase